MLQKRAKQIYQTSSYSTRLPTIGSNTGPLFRVDCIKEPKDTYFDA